MLRSLVAGEGAISGIEAPILDLKPVCHPHDHLPVSMGVLSLRFQDHPRSSDPSQAVALRVMSDSGGIFSVDISSLCMPFSKIWVFLTNAIEPDLLRHVPCWTPERLW